jgi:hypothetical protein
MEFHEDLVIVKVVRMYRDVLYLFLNNVALPYTLVNVLQKKSDIKHM